MSAQSSSLTGSLLKKVIFTFVVLVCTSIILSIALILELNEEWIEKLTVTSVMLTLCFGVFVATGAVMRRHRIAVTMWFSCGLTLVGTVLVFILVWGDHHHQTEEDVGRICITFLILGIGLAHSGVYSVVSTHTRVLFYTKLATMACVWICATLVITIFWYEVFLGSINRVIWTLLPFCMLSVLASLIGSIIVPIAAVSHANKTQIANESISSRVKILLECPKCAKRQELSSGNARCVNCKVSIFIEIEEPRCECGYLLYQLQGDVCPECGRLVPESEKWKAIPAGIDIEATKLEA